MIHTMTLWSVDTAGWRLQDDGEVLTLLACDADAALQFLTRRKPNGMIGDAELRAMADLGSPKAPPRHAVRCGDFNGYAASYVQEQTHWRIWWLAHQDVHVYVAYNGGVERSGTHDAIVDWMLSTLRRAVDVA